jgi:hypothetical protein
MRWSAVSPSSSSYIKQSKIHVTVEAMAPKANRTVITEMLENSKIRISEEK